jgi:hypothetical protein
VVVGHVEVLLLEQKAEGRTVVGFCRALKPEEIEWANPGDASQENPAPEIEYTDTKRRRTCTTQTIQRLFALWRIPPTNGIIREQRSKVP